ncbi:hypothetical protein ACVIJ1_001631 [Bradyrhizobium elkanii]
MDRGRLAGIVAQHAERAQAVAAGAADRCAHVERVELGQFLEIGFDEFGELEQHVLPLERLHLAPGPFERAARRRDRTVDVLGIALGDRREQLTGGGIMRLEFLAGGGVDPFAVDQHLLVGAIGIRMARDRNSLRNSHVCTPCKMSAEVFWKRYIPNSTARTRNRKAEPALIRAAHTKASHAPACMVR